MVDLSSASGNDNRAPLNRDDEREANVMIDQALKQVERGVDAQEALASVLALLPAHLQSLVKQRFAARLEQSKNKVRVAPVAAKPAVGLKQALTLVAQRTLERILSMLKSRPEIQRRVMEAGNALLRNGVAVDMVRVTESDLGHLPPSQGVVQAKSQQAQR